MQPFYRYETSPRIHNICLPAGPAQWLRRCAADPKDANSIPAAEAGFLMEVKSEIVLASRFWRMLKKYQVTKINPQPSTAARLIAKVSLRRFTL